MQNLGRITNHHLVISDSEWSADTTQAIADAIHALRPDLPAARA
jgi:hypothetical protein